MYIYKYAIKSYSLIFTSDGVEIIPGHLDVQSAQYIGFIFYQLHILILYLRNFGQTQSYVIIKLVILSDFVLRVIYSAFKSIFIINTGSISFYTEKS